MGIKVNASCRSTRWQTFGSKSCPPAPPPCNKTKVSPGYCSFKADFDQSLGLWVLQSPKGTLHTGGRDREMGQTALTVNKHDNQPDMRFPIERVANEPPVVVCCGAWRSRNHILNGGLVASTDTVFALPEVKRHVVAAQGDQSFSILGVEQNETCVLSFSPSFGRSDVLYDVKEAAIHQYDYDLRPPQLPTIRTIDNAPRLIDDNRRHLVWTGEVGYVTLHPRIPN
ncbi:hypothetical protein EDD17DRAFT_1897308 [Pisolithus thermaeus]|nr:hypothetical protein EDD17DRAFT_1897308 [Pisolithus thermaeus]